MPRAISITETLDLSAFRRPMKPIPERVKAAIARGVVQGPDLLFADAAKILEPGGDGMTDAVIRNSNGMLTTCCLTDMPGNTPEMWDWWFGWHNVSAERYKLWHPEDHIWSGASEDRRTRPNLRDRYIGLDSFVDEHVASPEIRRLTISFRRPSSFGLDEAKVDKVGTAICAVVGLRGTPLNAARLVHFIRRTPTGAEMLSRFWNGDVDVQIPILGRLISPLLNTPASRLKLLPDHGGLNLLRHCAEEMNHLASILPELYAKFGD